LETWIRPPLQLPLGLRGGSIARQQQRACRRRPGAWRRCARGSAGACAAAATTAVPPPLRRRQQPLLRETRNQEPCSAHCPWNRGGRRGRGAAGGVEREREREREVLSLLLSLASRPICRCRQVLGRQHDSPALPIETPHRSVILPSFNKRSLSILSLFLSTNTMTITKTKRTNLDNYDKHI